MSARKAVHGVVSISSIFVLQSKNAFNASSLFLIIRQLQCVPWDSQKIRVRQGSSTTFETGLNQIA